MFLRLSDVEVILVFFPLSFWFTPSIVAASLRLRGLVFGVRTFDGGGCLAERKRLREMAEVEIPNVEDVFFVGGMCGVCSYVRQEGFAGGTDVLKKDISL